MPATLPATNFRLRELGSIDYAACLAAMQQFTAERTPESADEIWLAEHPPVYTLGQAGKPEHLLAPSAIPLLQSDRGGQITYHGPGQAVVYPLLDLARRKLKVRETVFLLEEAALAMLAAHGISGSRRDGAPGVYVGAAKIAALGLRVRQGCCYHGISLNVAMDLAPFAAINPCGYPGLAVTQMSALGSRLSAAEAARQLAGHIIEQLEKRP